MAEIIDVADINIPELEIYTHLTDARLRKVYEYEHGIFIACLLYTSPSPRD